MRYLNSMNPWVATLLSLFVIGTLGFAGRVLAQNEQPVPRPDFDRFAVPGTTPVAIAISNDLPRPDLNIVIKRRANVKPNDVILVRPAALEPTLVAAAVETLRTTRRAFGRVPDGDAFIGVQAPRAKPPRTEEAVGWVASLRSSKPLDLPGVGVVQMILLHPFDREISKP